jgi:hypothetical protein
MSGSVAGGEDMETFYLQHRRRYFVYLSRSKTSMLYGQIDKKARERIAVSLRIKVPFIEGEIRQPELTETTTTC